MIADEVQRMIASRSIECGDCVLWRGGCSNGHPSARVDGKWQLLRRVLHEANYGPIPRGKVLRVTCDNKKCLNPEHWKVSTFRAVAIECSRIGLMSDRVRSGKIAAAKRASSQARITQDDARAIRASNDTGAALARRYGIAESTVSKIRRGEVRREFAGNVWAGLA